MKTWAVARSQTQNTSAVHIEDYEGWWLSSCRGSVAMAAQAMQKCPGFDSWQLLAFSLFCLITSEFISIALTCILTYV